MDRRRVVRLAKVLVASQMRSGRSTSSPNDFFGQPGALVVADIVAFLATYAIASWVVSVAAARDPETLLRVAPQVMAFLPLLVLGAVLLAGLLFELSTTSRFAVSDAANWLPISPVEYVAASTIAASFVYSTTAAIALGVGTAVTVATGNFGGLFLAAVLTILTLFEGGIIVEMLRASTQRITSVVSRRTGRATLVLRLIVFLLLILSFQLAFNPLVLFDLLQTLSAANPSAYAIPFLWPSFALLAFLRGDLFAAAALTAGSLLLAAVLVVAAAWLRVLFWVPVGAEMTLGHHRYALDHPFLATLGLSAGESSLVWKDLRGLVRRREMLPVLVVPVVITLISLLSASTSGRGAVSEFGNGVLAAIAPGLFALLLSATSFGQERRAIQNLYSLPVAARSVFRAKVASILLPALGFAAVVWIVVGLGLGLPGRVALGLLVLMPGITAIACFLGLTFATRFSDFQERPRPQFLRPSAMIGAMVIGMFLVLAISLPILVWLNNGSDDLFPLLFPIATAIIAVAATYRLARSGAETLMRSVPV